MKRCGAPDNLDIPQVGTPEEYTYLLSVFPMIRSLMDTAEIVDWRNMYPSRYLPSPTNMLDYREAYRWVRDYDFEVPLRRRIRQTRTEGGRFDPDIFVGWQNQEIHGMARAQ